MILGTIGGQKKTPKLTQIKQSGLFLKVERIQKFRNKVMAAFSAAGESMGQKNTDGRKRSSGH